MEEKIKSCESFEARIYMGLKEGYSGPTRAIDEVYEFLKNVCDKEKFAVSVAPTYFVYPGGEESGVVITFINYARFPEKNNVITNRAISLAFDLVVAFKQQRCTVWTHEKTYLIESPNCDKEAKRKANLTSR